MRRQALFHRRPEWKESAKKIAALSLMILLFSGCAAVGGGVSQTQSSGETTRAVQTERAKPRTTPADDGEASSEEGSATVSAGAADRNRSGEEDARAAASGAQADSGRAILRLTGSSGARFSGECKVGGESQSIEGELPERFAFDLGGGELACDIEKRDPGELRVVLNAGNSNVVQTTAAEDTTISLVYRDGNVRAFQSSSSSSVIQQSGTSVSQSNVVVQNGSSSVVNTNPRPARSPQ